MDNLKYKLGRALLIARKLHGTRRIHGLSYPEMIRRLRILRNQHLYTVDEIFLRGLLMYEPSGEGLKDFMSKRMTLNHQRRLNPEAAEGLTEDKGIFYGHCLAHGLPMPDFFAVFGAQLAWTAGNEILRSDGDRVRLLNELPSDDIVIKPCAGVYGQGVRLLRRDGDEWVDQDGIRQTSEQIVAALRRDPDYDSFVVQRRAFNHPILKAFSDTDVLQTVRIVTAFSVAGDVEILMGSLKLIAGDATTDNYSAGTTGNLIALVDIESGRLGLVLGLGTEGLNQQPYTAHPVTGRVFSDFETPLWHECCDLARRAAQSFLPLLTVGWDIAVTPDGPILIEGNAGWDPHNGTGEMNAFRDYLQHTFGADTA